MYTAMSRLINVANSVYEELTRIKKERGQSYSEVIGELVQKSKPSNKTHDWKEVVEWAEQRAKKFRGKREKTDIDLIVYGVSRDSR